MPYCPECGAGVGQSQAFCSDCGESLEQQPGAEGSQQPHTEDARPTDTEEDGFQVGRALASLVMGAFVGGFGALAFANIGGSSVVFFLVLAGVTYYLYTQKSSAREAIGSGCYILAVMLPLSAVFFYIPNLASDSPETAEAAGKQIGSALGILLWGFAGLILGLGVAGLGKLIKPSDS